MLASLHGVSLRGRNSASQHCRGREAGLGDKTVHGAPACTAPPPCILLAEFRPPTVLGGRRREAVLKKVRMDHGPGLARSLGRAAVSRTQRRGCSLDAAASGLQPLSLTAAASRLQPRDCSLEAAATRLLHRGRNVEAEASRLQPRGCSLKAAAARLHRQGVSRLHRRCCSLEAATSRL